MKTILTIAGFIFLTSGALATADLEILAVTGGQSEVTVTAGAVIDLRVQVVTDEPITGLIYDVVVPGAGWVLQSRSYGAHGWDERVDDVNFSLDVSMPEPRDIDIVNGENIERNLWEDAASAYDFHFETVRSGFPTPETGTLTVETFRIKLPAGLSPGVYDVTLANFGATTVVSDDEVGVAVRIARQFRFYVDVTKTTSTLSLGVGWNLISPSIEPVERVERILSVAGTGSEPVVNRVYIGSVWGWSSQALEAVRNLTTAMGYWVYLKSPATITFDGYNAISTALTLESGWNLVGSVVDNFTLPDDGSVGDTMWSWDGERYIPAARMNLGKGYWVFKN